MDSLNIFSIPQARNCVGGGVEIDFCIIAFGGFDSLDFPSNSMIILNVRIH
jgi:hypothetical protein